jgi:hypothetical protein
VILADVRTDDTFPAFFWFFFLFVVVLGIGGIVLWIWALVDCIRVPDDRYYRSGTKLVWVLVIALLQGIGAIVYLVAGRPDKKVRAGWTAGGSAQIPPPPPPPPI